MSKELKIRGHKRRQRDIEKWRLENLKLRIDILEKYDYDHIDIIVHPWCDISIINSVFPEPQSKTKQLMLNGLIDIYYAWKEQLDKLGKQYYLKIWLCEPRFSKSQVVCAINERIDYYENIFFKPEYDKKINPDSYGHLKNKVGELNWDYYLDENHFDKDEIGEAKDYRNYKDYEENKRWFTNMFKKPHRTTKRNSGKEFYSFKMGDLWVGGQE